MDDRNESVRKLVAGIRRAGWGDIAALLLEALEPLAPFTAQILHIIRPSLGFLVEPDDIAALAEHLERPDKVAELRRALTDAAETPGERDDV